MFESVDEQQSGVDAKQAAASIARGAATGGLAGAAKSAVALGLKDPRGRKVIIASISFVLAVVIFLVSLPMMILSSLDTNVPDTVRGGQTSAALRAALDGGVGDTEELSILVDAADRRGLLWEVLYATFLAQQSFPDPDNRFGVNEPSDVPEPGASDLEASANYVAGLLRDAVIASASLSPDQEIAVGTEVVDGQMRFVDRELADNQVIGPYTTLLAALPLKGASDVWAGQVILNAISIRMGQTVSACSSQGANYLNFDVPAGSWVRPTIDADGVVGSPFGMRFHPILKISRMHNGIDLGNERGTPVWAVAAGTVISIDDSCAEGVQSCNGGAGNMVVISHGSGVVSKYLHLNRGSVAVTVGSTVQPGQQLAQMGSTGLSTAPHLHFGIQINGIYVDPDAFLKQRGVDVTAQPGGPTSGGPLVDGTSTAAAAALPDATSTDIPDALRVVTADGRQVNLNKVQMDRAALIVGKGRSLGLSDQMIKVALMTAMQESTLRNLASRAVPASMALPNDGVAVGDHDSVGIFQQRALQGTWGSVTQIMDPNFSTAMFYGGPTKPKPDGPPGLIDVLARNPELASAKPGLIAQTVQVSAYPDAYDKWEEVADAIISALKGLLIPGQTAGCSSALQGSNFAGTAPYMDGKFTLSNRLDASNARLQPSAIFLKRAVAGQFPQITTIGGWRASARDPNGHPSGRAIDIMIDNYRDPNQSRFGDEVTAWLIANAKELKIDYLIWKQQHWSAASGQWRPMADRGDDTQNHYDHVHVQTAG